MFRKYVAARFAVLALALAMAGCGGGMSSPPPTPPGITPPTPAAPTASLSANPATITEGGSSILAWQTANATTITIDVLGAVAASGSESVAPTATTTYTLTAEGAGGTQTATATITVNAPAPPPPPPAPPSAWTVSELPPLFGQTDSIATGINDAGDVVGTCLSKGDEHGCLWKADDLENPIDLGANFRHATAINNTEQVVGQSDNGHVLLWPDMLELTEPDGFTSSIANGINDSGEIVGTLFNIDPTGATLDKSEGFSWTREGGFHLFADCSQALAVNNGGVVVGIVMNPDPNVPFLGGATECGGPVLFPNTGAATAINSSGVAVGYTIKSATEADVSEAMEFPSVRIGPGAANGINDNGWVVGTVTPVTPPAAPGSFPTAFFWTPTTNLVTIPGMLTGAGVNLSGSVAGLGPNANNGSQSQRAAVAVGQ